MLFHKSLSVFLLGVLLHPSSGGAHPCDTATPNTRVCDPSTGGSRYFLCMSGGVRHEFSCPPGLVFNNEIQTCDWAANVQCSGDSGRTTSRSVLGTKSTTGISSTTAAAAATTTTTTTTTATRATPKAGGTTPTTTTTTMSGTGTSVAAAAAAATATTTTTTMRTTPKADGTTTTTAQYPAGTCNPASCQLPDCRCVGTDIPANLRVTDVPQMVMLTFDDAVNTNNFHYYQRLFPASESEAVKNPNGCRSGATFFVDGTWTDMTMVKTLVDRGSEVASHSLTHTAPSSWTAKDWDREIEGMRETLANGTGLPLNKVVGMRAPFLELGAEKQFSMLEERNFLYDSSMYGGSLREDSSPPLWPFTLAYPPQPSQRVCDQRNCPTRSYPKVWEVPIIRQYNLGGQPCSMTDSCSLGPSPTKDDVKDFLRHNFNRHFQRNRAPFMISLHATWFSRVSNSFQGLKEFLQEISQKPEVWQVTLTQMLDWVRHPVPLSRVNEIPSWQCSRSSQTQSLNAV